MTHEDQKPNEWDVYVNDDCIGCAACVAICWEVFDMDDEWKAFPTANSKQTEDIDDAIMACPVNAIHYKN